MLKYREKGRPLSRANDQVILDAAARLPRALKNSRMTMILVMTMAPAFDPTAAAKISIKGYCVELFSAASEISPALKSTAISIPNERQPLIRMLRIMERATSVVAFLTSSDI